MPGLHDAHIHTEWVVRPLVGRPARGAVARRGPRADPVHMPGPARRRAAAQRPVEPQPWAVPVQPDRHSLDSVTGDRVAALSSVDGHTIWANSLALQRAGITRDTPDPVGGEIVRDAAASRRASCASRRRSCSTSSSTELAAAAAARARAGPAALGRADEHHGHRR